jgi:uncharacterized membrane protein SirB2
MVYVGQTEAMMILYILHGTRFMRQHSVRAKNVNTYYDALCPMVLNVIVRAIALTVHK